MNSDKLRKLITAALMAALSCVATFAIHIPTPGNGYIHPGDAFVLLSGIILGPVYGALAGGIGSMFADIFVAYPYYWVTLIIKALAAAVAALIYKKMHNKATIITIGIVGGIIVTTGYFIFEIFIYRNTITALTGVPFNLIQNIFGIVLTSILYPLLYNVPQIKEMMNDVRNH